MMLGSPVRVKALVFLLLFSLTAAVVAQSAENRNTNPQPIDTTQLTAWLAGGVPSSRLVRMVAERGLATLPTRRELEQVESAGANQDLMKVLSSGNAQSARVGAPIPEALLKAIADARQQHLRAAEGDLHEALAPDPRNSALHFALGAIYRQEEKWDETYDDLTRAPRLLPTVPDYHGALA